MAIRPSTGTATSNCLSTVGIRRGLYGAHSNMERWYYLGAEDVGVISDVLAACTDEDARALIEYLADELNTANRVIGEQVDRLLDYEDHELARSVTYARG